MSGDTVGFISLGILMVVNIASVAYWAGNINSNIKSLWEARKADTERVKELEKRPSPPSLCYQHSGLEDRLRSVEIKEGAKHGHGRAA